MINYGSKISGTKNGTSNRTSKASKDVFNRVRSSVVAVVFISMQIMPMTSLLSPAKAYAAEYIAPNPALAQACGLDIALVADNSSSISSSELTQMKNAMNTFVDALSNTPTLFSLTRFSTTASKPQPTLTDNRTTIKNLIDGMSTSTGTNWEDGLKKASETLTPDPRPDRPNLVVFLTDGDPTISSAVNGLSTNYDLHMPVSITQANAIKQNGTRILTIGIGMGGSSSETRLKRISGTNINTGSVLDSDVITTDFAKLSKQLADFAKETCGGTISATKVIDKDGKTTTTQDQTPGADWKFTVGGKTLTTDNHGDSKSEKLENGTYSIKETAQPGYEIITASCTGATKNGTFNSTTLSVDGIEIKSDDTVSCRFYNRPTTGNLVVNKVVSGGTAKAEDFKFKVNNQTHNFEVDGSNSISLAENTAFTVEEVDVPKEYTVAYSGDCTGTIKAAVTKTCTITNTYMPNPTLTLKKVVINNNGGTAKASYWQLNAGNVINEKGALVDGTNQAEATTSTRTVSENKAYALSESNGPAGYTASNWICDGGNLVGNSITLSRGQNVTCTITNDDKAPSVTIIKEVLNPYGTALEPSVFKLYLDGNRVNTGQTYTNFIPGSYVVSEKQQKGYEFTGVSGNCKINNGQIVLLLDLGVSATCTLTNTAIQPKLIVKKIVKNNNSGTKKASDFTMVVRDSKNVVKSFPGNSRKGTITGLNEGAYSVSEKDHQGYKQHLSKDCSGKIKIGEVKTCIITNDDIENPKISVEKFGPDTAYEGETVTYTFIVTNTGDTKLTNVSIDDDITTDEVCPKDTLRVKESMECYATYVIPADQNDDVVNTVIARGTSPECIEVTDEDDHTLDVLHPFINIVKDGPQNGVAGTTVNYIFTVTNTGDVALENIDVQDPITATPVYKSGDTNGDNLLDLDETWVFNASYTIPADQTSEILNTAVACGYARFIKVDAAPKRQNSVIADLNSFEITESVDENIEDPSEAVCDSDTHTMKVTRVVSGIKGSSTGTAMSSLATTGQSFGKILPMIIFATSTIALAVSLRRQEQA